MAANEKKHAIFKVKAQGRTRLVVFDTQDLSLGRAAENDLAIDEVEMSRKHAIFRRSAQGCQVQDMGTSNGTQVNGRVLPEAELSHGDVVRVGEVEITYAETTRNPASLGAPVEWASQLKGFATPLSAADGEATILGLVDSVEGDAFEVRPPGDFDYELHDMPHPGDAPRDLDAELGRLETDPVADFDLEDVAVDAEPASVAQPVPAASAPATPAPAAPEVWELDEDAERLVLTLEIEGLEGELREVLQGLTGKTLELPKLRLRLKGPDLA